MQKQLDWHSLRHLRKLFTGSAAVIPDYWDSDEVLAAYDATLGQRIAWKWDAVLADTTSQLRLPNGLRLLDWGAGTGVASRSWLKYFSGLKQLQLWDRSSRARSFATEKLRLSIQQQGESTKVQPLSSAPDQSLDILLISHVMTEIAPSVQQQLQRLAAQSSLVVWVDAGTRAVSQEMVQFRDFMRQNKFFILGPCPHQGPCGMQRPENEQHWCHFFATAPQDVYTSAFWAQVADELQIDLRSLPLSYCVALHESQLPNWLSSPETGAQAEGKARVIGRPRRLKAECQLLVCEGSGVYETRFQKRDDKALFKQLAKAQFRREWPVKKM